MALSTYSDLQTSVGLWLNRSDLTTVMPDFIALAESDMNKRLRTPYNETVDSAFAVTGRRTTLPTNLAEVRSVFLNDSTRSRLDPYTGAGHLEDNTTHYVYNVVGREIELLITSYTLELRYWTKVPALAAYSTNDILTNFPEVYLLGSCCWAGYFMDDAQMIAKWEPKYERALDKANATRFRQFGSGLQVRAS